MARREFVDATHAGGEVTELTKSATGLWSDDSGDLVLDESELEEALRGVPEGTRIILVLPDQDDDEDTEDEGQVRGLLRRR